MITQRCDADAAGNEQARFAVTAASGVILFFCGHHYRANEPKFVDLGYPVAYLMQRERTDLGRAENTLRAAAIMLRNGLTDGIAVDRAIVRLAHEQARAKGALQ